ncbi:MAG: FHA domain-containing serine/threonine-protein kinase [Planctomycetota bacterium]|nr:FHA domain-containing serine/threonine-protein kinase [Planctomycetota bacterium]
MKDSTLADMTGTVFCDRYKIVGILGMGGMGAVYRAIDQETEVTVALKILREDLLQGSAQKQKLIDRFMREMRLSATLNHANVVRTLDFGKSGNMLFMICELIEGGCLHSRLKKLGSIPFTEAFRLFEGLLAGLDALHNAGYIHRDIKPANVLVGQGGISKIADMGLARATSEEREQLTRTGVFMGTPLYAAPEQIDGEKTLDIRCDLYAAGAMFYHLIAGVPPYRLSKGQSVTKLFRMHLFDPIPNLHALKPEVPKEFCDILVQLMAKEKGDRPENPKTVLAMLANLNTMQPAFVEAPQRTVPVVFKPIPMDASPEAEQSRSEVNTVIGATASPRLTRVKLEVSSSIGFRSLFVYGQSKLQCGRNKADDRGQDLCLRLRPDDDLSNQISGKHLSLRIENGQALVEDLGSSNGTKLDGQLLPKRQAKALTGRHELLVGDVLALTILLVPASPNPSLFISRPENGQDHAYALVPPGGELLLDVTPAGLYPLPVGRLKILNEQGLRCEVQGQKQPLVIDEEMILGSDRVLTRAFHPDDQKH